MNRVSEDAGVRPFICYRDGPIDWSPVLDQVVILSNGKDACGVFEPTQKGVYQAHTLFSPSCRGRRAIETGQAMLRHMFDEEYAVVIWGATPLKNKAARWFNRQIGMKSYGFDEYEVEGPVEMFGIRK